MLPCNARSEAQRTSKVKSVHEALSVCGLILHGNSILQFYRDINAIDFDTLQKLKLGREIQNREIAKWAL